MASENIPNSSALGADSLSHNNPNMSTMSSNTMSDTPTASQSGGLASYEERAQTSGLASSTAENDTLNAGLNPTPTTGATGTSNLNTKTTSSSSTAGLGNTSSSTTGRTEYGSEGYTASSTNRGPHDSNALNKADPRVDSDKDNRAAGISSTGLGENNTSTNTSSVGLGENNVSSSANVNTGTATTEHRAFNDRSHSVNPDGSYNSNGASAEGQGTFASESSDSVNKTTGNSEDAANNSKSTNLGDDGNNAKGDSKTGKIMEKVGETINSSKLVEKGEAKREKAAGVQ